MWSAERRLVAFLVAVLVAVPASASASASDGEVDRDDRGIDVGADEEADPSEDAGDRARQTSGGTWECDTGPGVPAYLSFDMTDVYLGGVDGISLENSRPDDVPEDETWAPSIWRDCDGDPIGTPEYRPVPEEGEGGFDPVGEALSRALARLEPPVPAPVLAPQQRAITGMPAWLHVDHDWGTTVAVSPPDLPLTVEVFAEPQELVWDTVVGERVCDGPGIAWSEAAWADYQQVSQDVRGRGNPACTFTFTDTSAGQPDGRYGTTVSIRYAISWRLNGGEPQPLQDFVTTTDLPVEVGEVRAVRTR